MIALLLLALAQEPVVDRSALDAATATIQAGSLDQAALAAAWADKARAYALLGDDDKATRAFAVAVRVDPALAGDDPALQAALAERPARWLEATATRRDGVRLAIDVDDLQLAKGARLLAADGAVVGDVVLSGAAAAFPADGARVVLVDKYGNALRTIDVVDPPAEVTAAPAPASTSWLSLVGAATIGVGGAGVIAAGLGYATVGVPGGDEVAKNWLLAGTAAATGVVLVGGALVVADKLLSGG